MESWTAHRRGDGGGGGSRCERVLRWRGVGGVCGAVGGGHSDALGSWVPGADGWIRWWASTWCLRGGIIGLDVVIGEAYGGMVHGYCRAGMGVRGG